MDVKRLPIPATEKIKDALPRDMPKDSLMGKRYKNSKSRIILRWGLTISCLI